MNAAQIHLVVNHLPVIIPMVGAPILGVGVFIRSSDVQKVGLWLLVLSALVAIPAYLTGEPAENFLKNYPGVSRMDIHQHLAAADLSLIGVEIVGAFSLFLLAISQFGQAVPRYIWGALIALSLASSVLLMRTAHLGGQIRHEEIQTAQQL